MYRTAVVNSKSFGRHAPDIVEKLKRYSDVVWLELDKSLKGRELAEKLKGYHFIIASVTPLYDREFFEHDKDVLLIARHGIGVDNVDLKAATDHGVIVTRVPGFIERDAVAELAVALALNAIRKVCYSASLVKKNRWKERGNIIGFNIRGKKVGVIGLGNIGSRVAEIYRYGFNAEVLAYDPYIDEEYAASHGARLVDLETLLKESDIITLHTPLTKETYHMLSHREFETMKDGVVIVNAARGELIDTDALIEALKTGKVSAAGLDVIENEPITGDHPILNFDNVVLTPHIGANTIEGIRGMDESNVNAIVSVIEGKPPLEYTVNREVFEKGTRAKLHAEN